MLILIMTAASVTGCGTQNTKERPQDSDASHHYLYFKDSSRSDHATATFFNSDSGDHEEIEMTEYSEDSDSRTFCCEGNSSLYNMAKISYGDNHTKEFAFNKCVSGWYESEDGFLPYTEGEAIDYQPEFDEITLDCNGYEKEIHVWKPDDYDADSEEKYASVYVLDGQTMAFIGRDGQSLDDCEVVTEQVRAMTSVTGEKAIVIAVDTYGNMRDITRDAELAPDLSAYLLRRRWCRISKRTTTYIPTRCTPLSPALLWEAWNPSILPWNTPSCSVPSARSLRHSCSMTTMRCGETIWEKRASATIRRSSISTPDRRAATRIPM